jgi:hypothetical protein
MSRHGFNLPPLETGYAGGSESYLSPEGVLYERQDNGEWHTRDGSGRWLAADDPTIVPLFRAYLESEGRPAKRGPRTF